MGKLFKMAARLGGLFAFTLLVILLIDLAFAGILDVTELTSGMTWTTILTTINSNYALMEASVNNITNAQISPTANIDRSKLASATTDPEFADHSARHEPGGADEVGDLDILNTGTNVSVHASRHADGGADPLGAQSISSSMLQSGVSASFHTRIDREHKRAAATGVNYVTHEALLDPNDVASDVAVDIEVCGDWIAVLVDASGTDRVDFFDRDAYTKSSLMSVNLEGGDEPTDMTCDTNGLLWIVVDGGVASDPEQIKQMTTGATPAVVSNDPPWLDLTSVDMDGGGTNPDLISQIVVDPNVEFVYLLIELDGDSFTRDVAQFTISDIGATYGSYTIVGGSPPNGCTGGNCFFQGLQYYTVTDPNGAPSPRMAVSRNSITGGAGGHVSIDVLDTANFDLSSPSTNFTQARLYQISPTTACDADTERSIRQLTYDGDSLVGFDSVSIGGCADGWMRWHPENETSRTEDANGSEPLDIFDVSQSYLNGGYLPHHAITFDGVYHVNAMVNTTTDRLYIARLRAGEYSDNAVSEFSVYSAATLTSIVGVTSDGVYDYILFNASSSADWQIYRALVK